MSNEPHECDLFLLTSHAPYLANRILPEFARHCRNLHGWGLGYYVDGEARIVRRSAPAFEGEQLSAEFGTAVEVVSSSTILGHLRLTLCGQRGSRTTIPFGSTSSAIRGY